MIKSTLTGLFVCTVFLHALGQPRTANYYFERDFNEQNDTFIPLKPLGGKGYFVREVIEKFGDKLRTVYVFPKSSGLLFDNSKVKNFINGSYAVEMYFRYDNGSLLLYNQLLGDKVDQKEGQYVHLVVTREAGTQRVIVFLDGRKEMEFHDSKDQIAMTEKSQLMFFQQDGMETSSGAVAMIKIYNTFIDEEMAKALFGVFEDEEDEPINLKSGESLVLNKLYFRQSRADLLPESFPELERLMTYLLANKEVKIEVQGHTDNQGDYELNIQLSKERAEAIRTYLVDHGIDGNRIKTVGYGGTKPMASNNDPSTRKLNRRVELLVL